MPGELQVIRHQLDRDFIEFDHRNRDGRFSRPSRLTAELIADASLATGTEPQSLPFCAGERAPIVRKPVIMTRILLVEDDLDVCMVMEHALIDGGYDVEATGRVIAAFVLLGSHPYDLVVTDVRLPDGSGI